jgi:hypothetical protein
MFSLSRGIASGFGLGLALSFVMAGKPLAAQGHDTAHKQGTTQMPKTKSAEKKVEEKKVVPKTAKAKKPAAGKSRVKTSKKPVPARAAVKKQATPSKAQPMPMSAPPHYPPEKAGQVQMPDTIHAVHGDTAHREMADLKMQAAPAKVDSTKMHGMPGMPSMPMDSAHGMPGMRGHSAEDMMVGPAGVSMERMGSGTTWIPDAVTMPSRNRMLHDWMIMTHGFLFAQYDRQSGERGDDQFGSLNWIMLMATRDAAGGRFQARTMLSLDPWTVSNRGYPLLLQTGETYNGEPLHDRQHPHDFWMELGALYQREIDKGLAWSIYAAPSGEPALGPVAFMHRPSAMDNPAAPLSHHWHDATHIAFGVLTGGIFSGKWQLEGSVFNGREPDERRWNFNPIKLDSYSGRLSVNPTANWSLAAGYGYLKSPESLHPDESMHRVTASVLHGARLGADGQWSSALIWGANKHSAESSSNAFLAETEAILDKRNTLFGRTELVQKSAEDLVVDIPVTTRNGTVLPGFPDSQRFNVSSLQIGYIREVARMHWTTLGLGAAGTFNFVPAPLEPYYGSRKPTGMFIFVRLRPFHSTRSTMRMNKMGGKQMEHEHD